MCDIIGTLYNLLMATFLYKNERKHVRRAVRLRCQVIREVDFRLVGDTALDVSPDGLLVRTYRRDIVLGDALLVSFQATDLGIWFDTDAEVTRIVKGRRGSDRWLGVGVRFGALDGVKRHILRGAFRNRPPPLPQRAPRIAYAASVARF